MLYTSFRLHLAYRANAKWDDVDLNNDENPAELVITVSFHQNLILNYYEM